ncbi:enoyl-CoA hydratase/isomerase family protein [Azospirillum oleiclasticum]
MALVDAELRDNVAVIRLNDPARMNALSDALVEGLVSALSAAAGDPAVRCIVITGTGNAFCAGGDLDVIVMSDPNMVRDYLRRMQAWAASLGAIEKPLIGAVNGAAVGAGLSLALLADIVVASRQARFQAAFPRLGAVPDLGLAYTLPRAVGHPVANDLLLTNRTLTAEEALALGLVSRVFDADSFDRSVLEIAGQLAKGPTRALGLTKRLLAQGMTGSLHSLLEIEAATQALAFATDDFSAGVAAFKERRQPRFTGA